MKVSDLSAEQRQQLTIPSIFAKAILGEKSLRPDQAQVMDSVGKFGSRTSYRTCNESGKTSKVITALVLWHLACFPKGFTVSTAGAWRQVKDQLVPNLKRYQARFPSWRFLETAISVSNIDRFVGFSTNDAGKFEGYHGNPEEPLMLLFDEAKTIPDAIYGAGERCNPQRWLIASSPGTAEGEFYRSQTVNAKYYEVFRTAAQDCPHLWEDEHNRKRLENVIKKWGDAHPLVRSMIHAEFMEMVEDAVLSFADWDKCADSGLPWDKDMRNRKAFCDFAAGGDENVLALREGNRVTLVDCWRDVNTMSAVGRFVTHFRKLGLTPGEIEGDEGGLGKPMCDALAEAGWPITRVNFGSPPLFVPHYGNIVSERWYEAAHKISKAQVVLPDDPDTRAQFCSRKRKFNAKGKLVLETKEDMKSRGLPSPDRADAIAGCMAPLLDCRSFNIGSATPNLDAFLDDFASRPENEIDERVFAGFQT